MSKQVQSDILIIGSGAAGLSLALRIANQTSVSVLAKGPIAEGSTSYAQGGVSAVMDQEDSIDSHVADTLNAGAGLCDPDIVRFTASQGKDVIEWLVDQGVAFTRERDTKGQFRYHLTREGGHSHRRVIHALDATGQVLENTLVEQVRNHVNIRVYEHHLALDLITGGKLNRKTNRCLGAYVFDRREHRVKVFRARNVVLATGGAGKVYLYTSNPDTATGDGIAMGWRAGCRVGNMEFMQFHPTCLYHPEAKSFLITEAIRGEGGRLILPDGTRFMQKFDPRGDLAPRDIVARAIDHEMKRLGSECLYLDISHKPAEFIREHFPMVYARCKTFGYDMTIQPLPIVPAAHYTCGGVLTDRHGATDLEGLYAIGEVAFTRLHGANRMASNSLLECLVFAKSATAHILKTLKDSPRPGRLPEWDESRVTNSDEEVVVYHNWDELRRFMRDYVGIVRTTKRLQRAKSRIDLLLHEIDEYYSNFRVTNDLIELRNLAVVADLIIRSALARKESLGLHFTLNHPHKSNSQPPQNTILRPD